MNNKKVFQGQALEMLVQVETTNKSLTFRLTSPPVKESTSLKLLILRLKFGLK